MFALAICKQIYKQKMKGKKMKNQNLQYLANTSFQNVKTQFINVGGTEFFYRKFGENNSGIPIFFLNHLSATMDECDARIMYCLARQHQVIFFDIRGVRSIKGS